MSILPATSGATARARADATDKEWPTHRWRRSTVADICASTIGGAKSSYREPCRDGGAGLHRRQASRRVPQNVQRKAQDDAKWRETHIRRISRRVSQALRAVSHRQARAKVWHVPSLFESSTQTSVHYATRRNATRIKRCVNTACSQFSQQRLAVFPFFTTMYCFFT